MARTAHVCQGGPGPRGPELDLEKLKLRKARREILLKYLDEDACIEGVPKDVTGMYPYVDELGLMYENLICIETLGHNGNQLRSLHSMKAFATLFCELWKQPASIQLPPDEDCQDYECLPPGHEIASAYSLEELRRWNASVKRQSGSIPDEDDICIYASTLGKSYAKAYAECVACGQITKETGDTHLLKHHTSLIGDIIDEMLDFSINPVLKEDDLEFDFPEHNLPTDHPHWIEPPKALSKKN